MPFRIATFLLASLLVAAGIGAIFGWKYWWLGAWLGAVLWLGLDAWRAQRLLHVLRNDGKIGRASCRERVLFEV